MQAPQRLLSLRKEGRPFGGHSLKAKGAISAITLVNGDDRTIRQNRHRFMINEPDLVCLYCIRGIDKQTTSNTNPEIFVAWFM